MALLDVESTRFGDPVDCAKHLRVGGTESVPILWSDTRFFRLQPATVGGRPIELVLRHEVSLVAKQAQPRWHKWTAHWNGRVAEGRRTLLELGRTRRSMTLRVGVDAIESGDERDAQFLGIVRTPDDGELGSRPNWTVGYGWYSTVVQPEIHADTGFRSRGSPYRFHVARCQFALALCVLSVADSTRSALQFYGARFGHGNRWLNGFSCALDVADRRSYRAYHDVSLTHGELELRFQGCAECDMAAALSV